MYLLPQVDFLSEAELMKRFIHHNIVSLLGVCTREEPVYNIMEFLLHGKSPFTTSFYTPHNFYFLFFIYIPVNIKKNGWGGGV